MSGRNRKIVRKKSTGRRIIEQGRIRLLCVGLFFCLSFGSIAVRMIEVAVIRNPQALRIIVADPDSNASEEVEVGASEQNLQRGDIVDRNGVLLATSLMTASVFVNPREIKNVDEAATRLSVALKQDKGRLVRQLSSGKKFVWIKRNLPPSDQQAVNSLGIPGLYFLPEEKRVYPHGGMFAHALGYVGVDNKGLAGMEKSFDARLRDPNTNRQPLALSLDVRLQAIMHSEIKQAMDEFNAIGATGVIMDIHTGELLSMVSLPDFDPQRPAGATDAQKFNRATLGTYEMGSTFKTFTSAMALDYGTVNMKSGYDATRPFKIAGFTISDTHGKARWLSVPEIYAYSSNIGTAKMALDVGGKRQQAFLEKLGMFAPVDIELSEISTPLVPKDWREISTVTISYGHGMAVSPLHLLRGIAGVTSGQMPTLTLLKTTGSKEGERVVKEETAQNVRRLMRLVVEHGTGGKADVPGYRVAGKTGTAEKNTAGRYNADAKIASFVSVFPADDPKYAVLVMVDEPKGNKSTYGYATGGWISAPVVGNVIARIGPLLGMKPRFDVPADDAGQYWTDKEEAPTHTAKMPRFLVQAVARQ
ncbi:MAG: penicillin-binding protein 2 [Alphaproteobacteria bacterium]|nr:penicillin-binding protein 2 [Alphaproteobacteria bacterium]